MIKSFLLLIPLIGMAFFPKDAGRKAVVTTIAGLPIEVSTEARDLIVHYEVGGKAYYEKFLEKATYPGGASGVTVGFGYDLGYNTPAQIRADWKGRVSNDTIAAMVSVSGLKGSRAANELRRVRGAIVIPWDTAQEVFGLRTMPRFAAMTKTAFPDIALAHPHGQGVVLSLSFNRGTSMRGDSRREMRWVRHNLGHDQSLIPADIRAMKRLWIGKGLDGLLIRREAEAALFEKGLQQN